MKKIYLFVILIVSQIMAFAQQKSVLYTSGLDTIYVTAENTGICEGDSTKLSYRVEGSGSLNLKAKWTPNYCISSDTDGEPTVFPEQTTTYQVVVTNIDENKSVTGSIKISVVPRPKVVAPLNDTVCANGTGVVLNPPEPPQNTQAVKWTTPNGKGEIQFPDSVMAIYNPDEDDLGEDVMIILAGEAIDYCETVYDTTILTFVPEIYAKIITEDTFLCVNSTLQLAGNTDASSYSWSHTGEGYFINGNKLNPLYVPSEKDADKYVSVILMGNASGCYDYDTLTFKIGSLPKVGLSATDTACASHPVTVQTKTFKNVETFEWSHSGSGYLIYSEDSTTVTYMPTSGEIGDISVKINATSDCGCEVSDSAVITYTQETTAKILTKETMVCADSTLQIEGYVSAEDSFAWSCHGYGELTKTNTLNPAYVPAENERSEVTVMLTAYGKWCNDIDTLTFNVGLAPEVRLPDDETACINTPVLINPEVWHWVSSAKWGHTGNGSFSYATDSSSVTYEPAPDELGNITVNVEVTSTDGFTANDAMNIFYVKSAYANIKTNDTTICSNTTLTLEAEAQNYTSYQWNHNGEGELSDASSINPVYTPAENESGTVRFIFVAYGIGNQSSDTAYVKISSMYLGDVDDVTVCEGDNAWLGVYYSDNYEYLWNTGETTNQINVTATESTNYTISVTNEDNCSANTEIYLDVIDRPIISLSANTEDQILTISPDGLNRYDFYDQDNNLLSSGSQNYFDYSSVIYTVESIYVIAYNDSDCASDASDGSNIFEIPKMVKINAFSPNGDGINDRLLPGRRIKVIDRSSKILYEGWDGWDGTYSGKKMPEGSYFYILYDGNDIYYKSAVTLLRKGKDE